MHCKSMIELGYKLQYMEYSGIYEKLIRPIYSNIYNVAHLPSSLEQNQRGIFKSSVVDKLNVHRHCDTHTTHFPNV